MEFRPRTLGNLSIVGNRRNPEMLGTLNLRVKFRENCRLLAPLVLREDIAEWFERDSDSPYMMLV